MIDVPKGWSLTKFGDVVDNIKINVDAQESDLERYVAGEHMETDNLRILSWGIIGDGYLGPAFHRKFEKGQILYGSRRTYLRKVAVADFDGICANTTFVLQANGKLIHELLPFLMQSEAFTEHSINNSKGSTNPYINYKDIAKYEFPFPPLDEQHRMADLLWTLEDAIRKKDEISQVMRKLKADYILHSIRNGKSGVTLKKTKIGNIPADWDLRPIGEIVKKCQYGLSNALSEDGKYPVFRMLNLEEGKVVPSDMKYVDLSEKEFKNYAIEDGDILFNRTNSHDLVGKSGIYHLSGDYVFASYLVRLKANKDVILPDYLNYYMNCNLGQLMIKAWATPGVSQSNINAKNLMKVLVPTPPIKQQRQIAEILSKLDRNIEGFEAHKLRLENLKKRLLNDLLTGKRRLGGV